MDLEALTARSFSALCADQLNRQVLAVDTDIDLRALHAARPQHYPYLLESAARGTAQGRFDILLAAPGQSLWLDHQFRLHGATSPTNDFLHELRNQFLRLQQPRLDQPVPFVSGWFIFLSYELAAQLEGRLKLPAPRRLPVAAAVRVGGAIVRDHLQQAVFICAENDTVVDAIQADLHSAASHQPTDGCILVEGVEEEPAERFITAADRVQRHIEAGDLYQANLSRRWQAQLRGPVSDAALYAAVCEHNPGPFAALACFAGQAIISSSPERLIEVRDRRVQTRPIAGTRPRGATATDDQRLVRELISNSKERAEHVMLIDLERNDLGRVCEPGSVEVDEFMTAESYAHVHHIVSNVRGRLREDLTPVDAIGAVFPGGTITGCPKLRCMQVIGSLEGVARGAYTGSLGYLDLDGSCDLNILIRTLVRHRNTLSLRAGAGIVADSQADKEVEETRAKARGLLLALGVELR